MTNFNELIETQREQGSFQPWAISAETMLEALANICALADGEAQNALIIHNEELAHKFDTVFDLAYSIATVLKGN